MRLSDLSPATCRRCLRRLAGDALDHLGTRTTVIGPLVEAEQFPFRDRRPLRPRFLSARNFEPCDNGATALLRAFASGLPVVSTAAGAVPSILTHGVHGLLAPLADYQTLGHHALRLISSPDYARGLAGAAKTAGDADRWPRVREQSLRTYRGVVAGSARAPRSALTSRVPGAVSFAGADRGEPSAAGRHAS